MKVAFSNRSVRQYGKLPASVQARFDKQLGFLLSNLQHPSLRAKKYDEAANIWQARSTTITASISRSMAPPIGF